MNLEESPNAGGQRCERRRGQQGEVVGFTDGAEAHVQILKSHLGLCGLN